MDSLSLSLYIVNARAFSKLIPLSLFSKFPYAIGFYDLKFPFAET